jgi:hypothetical protein
MKLCPACLHNAEWRYTVGWGVLACADWFAGTCEGDPVEIAPPSMGGCPPSKLETEQDERYAHWVQTRLSELWPLARSV